MQIQKHTHAKSESTCSSVSSAVSWSTAGLFSALAMAWKTQNKGHDTQLDMANGGSQCQVTCFLDCQGEWHWQQGHACHCCHTFNEPTTQSEKWKTDNVTSDSVQHPFVKDSCRATVWDMLGSRTKAGKIDQWSTNSSQVTLKTEVYQEA